MPLELIKDGDSHFLGGSFHHFPSVDQVIDCIRCVELAIDPFFDLIELYLLLFPLEAIDLVVYLQLKGLHVLLFHNDCVTRISQSFKAHLRDCTIETG